MKLFDKERFKGRIKWIIIGVLLLLWASVHFMLLNEYRESADTMSGWIKLFIANHIVWWYISPFIYGILGLSALAISMFSPKSWMPF